MINGSSIRRNALQTGREFFISQTENFNHELFTDFKHSQYEVEQILKFSHNSTIKAFDINFKRGSLTHMLFTNANFKDLSLLLSDHMKQPLSDQKTLEFLNECMMISAPQKIEQFENSIDDQTASLVNDIVELVCVITQDLTDDFGGLYMSALINKAQYLALSILGSDERRVSPNAQSGKRPLETAMQMS